MGVQLQNVANIWQIFELTGSPLQIGLTGLARAIPDAEQVVALGRLAHGENELRRAVTDSRARPAVDAA